jgi:GNAT superfamily N-acetyltransferase
MENEVFCDMVVREASKRDIAAMASNHRKMFAEIWEQKGRYLEPARAVELESAYALKLADELEMANCKAWVVEDKGAIVASGAISIVSFVPNPIDLSPRVAYLHSMFTEKSHRGHKCAERIVGKMIDYCKSQGIRRIMLNASDAGRPVYQKLGFHDLTDMMRLLVS